MRAVLTVFAITEAIAAVRAAASGSMFAVFPLFLVAFLAREVYLLSTQIRQCVRAACQPDYLVIARLECEIYGEAFRHDGSPYLGDFHPSDFPSQW
jgi:hypothetical protein